MPKSASYLLIWSEERERYELCRADDEKDCFPLEDSESWDSWLATHTSFAFRGRHGHLTLLKEPRTHGDGYWYAYRRQGKHVAKKYLGPPRKLSPEQLEEVARTLNAQRVSPDTISASTDVQPSPGELPADLMLEAKLRLPRQRASLVRRPALFARITAGLEHKMTLISAPAGFGKTTLVSAWAAEYNAQQARPAVAWLSLDEGDNDPLRFWHYLSTICSQIFLRQPIFSSPGSSSTRRLPEQVLESILAELPRQLALLSEPCVLVLEDYHLISSASIHNTLARLIERLPPALHIIILTRHDLPFSLARWRAYGDLSELHAADLRFSASEIRCFLEQTLPFPLSDEALEHLSVRSEGWAVGVQLAGLALQGCSSPQEVELALTTFTGSRRHVLEYLVEEVLHTQDEQLQHFLLSTSILHRLTPTLCNALTGREDGELLLAQLEQANLFLVGLDGKQRWYRYHALFAEAMQQEALNSLGEAQLRTLHARACAWYEAHGLLNEAIESAFAAQEPERAATLIEHFQTIEQAGGNFTVSRWLERLPVEILHNHPLLCFAYAAILLFTHGKYSPQTRKLLEVPLSRAEQIWKATNNLPRLGEVLALRALSDWWLERHSESFALARQALTLLPEQDTEWRGPCLIQTGMAELYAGRLHTARQLITEGRACCEAVGNIYPMFAATLLLGDICLHQGDLHQALQFYQRVPVDADGDAGKYRRVGAPDDRIRAMIGQATLAYEWNHLEKAEQSSTQALTLARKLNDIDLQVSATLVLARTQHASHQSEQAQLLLKQLTAQSKKPRHLRVLLCCQAQLALADGDLATAQRCLPLKAVARTGSEPMPRLQEEQEMLLSARLAIATGETQRATDLLRRWQSEAREAGRIGSEMEISLYLALAYASQHDLPSAKSALLLALELAQPQGYLRLFLDAGESLLPLLKAALNEIHAEPLLSYVREIALSLGGNSLDLPCNANPLSIQEQRVLRLLAAGRTKPEIAEELIVSINTVKTQVKSIYRKLQVTSRKDAHDAARRLHLL